MMMKRDATLVFDHWFHMQDGGFLSGANYAPDVLSSRYLRTFSSLEILGRCRNASPGESLSSGDAAAADALSLQVVTNRGGIGGAIHSIPRLLRGLSRAAKESRSVLLVMPGMLGIIGGFWLRLRGRPYAVELVGDAGQALSVTMRQGFVAWLARQATRYVVKGATGVAYVTETSLQQGYPAGPGATVAVYSSIQLEPSHILHAVPARVMVEPSVITTVASMSRGYKGVDILLRALRLLVSGGSSVSVTVVGGGSLQVEYEALARELGIESRVSFIGHVGGPERVRHFLDLADIYAQPSLTEGLPRALIEAMARGLPCVGTRVGGIPDLLNSECVVAPGDEVGLAAALKSLMDSAEFRVQSARQNLEKSRSYSIAEIQPRRDAFYLTIADRM